MTDLVTARWATADDVAITAQLAHDHEGTLRDERGGRWHLEHDAPQTAPGERHLVAVESDGACLVVGCIDGVVVGYACAALSPTTTGQLCMIEELIVHPDGRAIGVGSEILAAVRNWAEQHQCQAIESQVLPGNRAAKNFFERVGMKTRKMRVSADL